MAAAAFTCAGDGTASATTAAIRAIVCFSAAVGAGAPSGKRAFSFFSARSIFQPVQVEACSPSSARGSAVSTTRSSTRVQNGPLVNGAFRIQPVSPV